MGKIGTFPKQELYIRKYKFSIVFNRYNVLFILKLACNYLKKCVIK